MMMMETWRKGAENGDKNTYNLDALFYSLPQTFFLSLPCRQLIKKEAQKQCSEMNIFKMCMKDYFNERDIFIFVSLLPIVSL